MSQIYLYDLERREITMTNRISGERSTVRLSLMSPEAVDHAALTAIARKLRDSANPYAEAMRLNHGGPWRKP